MCSAVGHKHFLDFYEFTKISGKNRPDDFTDKKLINYKVL